MFVLDLELVATGMFAWWGDNLLFCKQAKKMTLKRKIL